MQHTSRDTAILTFDSPTAGTARAFYETVIRRGEDVLAEVRSSWCCLDATTLRPTRLAAHIIERFFPPAR